jgi:hypothetical protein
MLAVTMIISTCCAIPAVMRQMAMPSITVGNCQMQYEDDCTTFEEAHAVCEKMIAHNYITTRPASVRLARKEIRMTLEIVVQTARGRMPMSCTPSAPWPAYFRPTYSTTNRSTSGSTTTTSSRR